MAVHVETTAHFHLQSPFPNGTADTGRSTTLYEAGL